MSDRMSRASNWTDTSSCFPMAPISWEVIFLHTPTVRVKPGNPQKHKNPEGTHNAQKYRNNRHCTWSEWWVLRFYGFIKEHEGKLYYKSDRFYSQTVARRLKYFNNVITTVSVSVCATYIWFLMQTQNYSTFMHRSYFILSNQRNTTQQITLTEQTWWLINYTKHKHKYQFIIGVK